MSKNSFRITPGTLVAHNVDENGWGESNISGIHQATGQPVWVCRFVTESLPFSCGQGELGELNLNKGIQNLEEIFPDLDKAFSQLALQNNWGMLFWSTNKHPKQKTMNGEKELDTLLECGFEPVHQFVNPNTGNEVWTVVKRVV